MPVSDFTKNPKFFAEFIFDFYQKNIDNPIVLKTKTAEQIIKLQIELLRSVIKVSSQFDQSQKKTEPVYSQFLPGIRQIIELSFLEQHKDVIIQTLETLIKETKPSDARKDAETIFKSVCELVDEINYDALKSLFTSRKKMSVEENNNELHRAIVNHDVKKSLEIIANDKEAKSINSLSWGNTPLLLALKKGEVEIALALLECEKTDVNAKDSRNLTALHIACMLRQDVVIRKLISKKAENIEAPLWTNPVRKLAYPLTPSALYENEVQLNFLTDYLFLENLAEKNFSNGIPQFTNGFIDRANLIIPGEPAYTDILIFHIDDVCTHLNWKNFETKFYSSNEIPSSYMCFKENYKTGISLFCSHRNSIPVNPEILRMLNSKQETFDLAKIREALCYSINNIPLPPPQIEDMRYKTPRNVLLNGLNYLRFQIKTQYNGDNLREIIQQTLESQPQLKEKFSEEQLEKTLLAANINNNTNTTKSIL